MKLEDTPVTVLKIKPTRRSKDQTVYELRVYWSKNAGIYGHQIGWEIFKNHGLEIEGLVKGYGSCKESYAFGQFIQFLTDSKMRVDDTVHQHLYKYHVGGNYYECTKSQLIKSIKKSI